MSMKRGRAGSPAVRKSAKVGPSYSETKFDAPWNQGIDGGEFGSGEDKAICSVAPSTYEGGGAPMNRGKYDPLWEGK